MRARVLTLVVACGLTAAMLLGARRDAADPLPPPPAPAAPPAPDTSANADHEFVWGIGPGAGQTSIAMGSRVYVLSSAELSISVPVPTFDLSVVHGLTDSLDYELRLSSLGLLNMIDTGVRLRTGDAALSVAGRLDATVLALFMPDSGAAAAFGITPGIAVSFGSRSSQVTLGSDVVLAFAAVGTADGSSFGAVTSHPIAFIRPSATYELGVGRKNSLYFQGGAYVAALGDGSGSSVVPTVAVGVSW